MSSGVELNKLQSARSMSLLKLKFSVILKVSQHFLSSGFLDMSGISLPELTDLTNVSSISSSASFSMPAAGSFVGTEKLMSNSDPSAYFGKCTLGFQTSELRDLRAE